MTVQAQGALSLLSYVEEAQIGVTPAPGYKLKNVPYTSHSLDITKDRVEGEDILADRMDRVDRHGNVRAGGDIVASFREVDYDDFLASAMFSNWAQDQLRVGTTPKTFSFEDAALDNQQFRRFRGMGVNTLSISIAPNAMVTTTFGFIGLGGDQFSTTGGDGSNTPHASEEPFDSFTGQIFEAGTPLGRVSSLELNIENGLAQTFSIGSKDATGFEFTNAKISGNLVAYYTDANLIRKFIDETETSLSVTVTNPTNSAAYTFLLPRVKLNGASVPVQNQQSRFVTIPIVGLKDAVENSPLVITRDLDPGN